MSDITVNVTNAGAANVAVSGGSTVNASVGNGGVVNVAIGSISPGNATVVSGTLTINSTTTLAAGSQAYVKNDAGTAYAAKLDIGIPAGPATLVSVGNTTTLAAGSNATVNGTADGSNLTLAFGIPRGVTPSFAIGNVTTGAAGSSASVVATTTNGGANVTLDLTIPRGDPGTSGSNGTNGTSITLSDATPANLGTASPGTSSLAARADHSHALPVISYANLSGVPSNFPTNTTLVSGLSAGYSGINHAHNYVTSLNNLTGALTLAAGSNVTLTTNGSTLTLASVGGGIGLDDSVDGGFYVGYVPQNTIAIATQPTAQTASDGAATFSVSATSTPGGTLSYQWERQDGGFGDFVIVSGATSATLSLAGLLHAVDDADKYRVVVSATNAVSVVSTAVLLTVAANTITITSQPSNQTASGGAATFTAAATVAPSGTPTYQWQRSSDLGVTWANISGATSASLNLTGMTVEADGNARFRAVVSATNAANATSSAATLTVESNNTITITSQPTNQAASGGAATFSLSATSSPSGNPAYQWQRSDLMPASGSTWTQRAAPYALYGMTHGNGVFVAVSFASNTSAASVDGATWTQGTLPSTSSQSSFFSVTHGNGVFVAVGYGARAATSADGITWTLRTLPSAMYAPRSVAYGNGVFVAIAHGGAAATSPDGVTWTQRTLPANAEWEGVAYGGGVFVAVIGGYSDSAATSADGIAWTLRTLPSYDNWKAIAYGNGLFAVVASGASVAATSPNGIAWTQRTLPASATWSSVAYGGGSFAAIAHGNTAATSTDGVTWTQRTLPVYAQWSSIAYGNSRFVGIASDSVTSVTSDPSYSAFANISGATSSQLALTGLVSSNDQDQYRTVVSASSAATVTSNAATLTVSG
jgi:hypothetical protein